MLNSVLFVHTNFPAQFRDLTSVLLAKGVLCAAIGSQAAPGMDGVRVARWNNAKGTTPGIFPLAIRPEADLIRGRAALDAALALKAEGFKPDLIIGHPGWGEMTFLAEAFPDARRICFSEFCYQGRGGDIDFDVEFIPATYDAILAGTSKNALQVLAMAEADAIVCPTPYQASTHPKALQSRIRLIHEGIDIAGIRPGPATSVTLPDGKVLEPGRPLITHVNRHLEPLRGLHILLRALPRVLAEAPDAQVVIVGAEDRRGYSGAAPEGETWKSMCLKGLESRLDLDRVHFTGRLAHADMLAVLRLSTAHVYYSYPFVLSWSLCEAMASGCYVVASDTAPVRDAIIDGVNGRLLPFFDVDALSAALLDACRQPDAFAELRASARRTAEKNYDSAVGRAAWLALIEDVMG